ncbi:dioxygenase, putative [Aspergillus fumigatus Z5]|nr:dioxygenase, putative [Aspergillus fumigatus Z5]
MGSITATNSKTYPLETESSVSPSNCESLEHFHHCLQAHCIAMDPAPTVSTRKQGRYALMEKARRTGDLKEVTFGQKRDPCESFFQKMKTVLVPTDSVSDPQMVNSNVTVFANMPGMLKHGPTGPASSHLKVLTCLTDANQITQANPETLEPIAASTQQELHPDLKGQLYCAHPQFDHRTGDVYNYNLHLGPRSTYRIYHTSAHTSRTEVIATFSIKAAYIHSFFMTEDYIIFCVWPAYFKGLGTSILWERNMLDAMKFDPTAQSHCMDTLHRTYYEDLLPPNGEASNFTLRRSETPMSVRYRLPRLPKESTTRTVVTAERVFGFESGELPTINPRFATKRARYHYCIVNRGHTSFFDGIGKVDLETQTIQYWGSDTAPHTSSESIFIPDGTGDAEDAGYLLSVVLNGETGASYLVCLDARTLTEVGRAEHDHAISFGLH